jgi:hypothetical protein
MRLTSHQLQTTTGNHLLLAGWRISAADQGLAHSLSPWRHACNGEQCAITLFPLTEIGASALIGNSPTQSDQTSDKWSALFVASTCGAGCLVCPSGSSIVAGGPLRARPRASADASGQRLVTFPSKALPCGSPGKTSRPDLALHGPSTGANFLIRRRRKQAASNEWKRWSRIANSELLGSRNWCSSGETNCIGIGATDLCGYTPSCGCRTGDEKRY